MNVFGIARSLVNPVNLASLAMGPAGWANLAMRTIGSQIAMNALQQIGQRMGLPQPMIDLAQASFANQMGMPGLARQNVREAVSAFASESNLSLRDQASLERAANDDLNNLIFKLGEAMTEGKERAKSAGSKGKGSWLQKIADAMARALDSKIQDMDTMARALDKQGKNRSIKASTDLQVAGQEFSYLMQSTSTVIKTIGEGLSTMARKQ
ncbi:hypothetical protein ACXYN8_00750 [Altererythrobacter sp. CAU 1778]